VIIKWEDDDVVSKYLNATYVLYIAENAGNSLTVPRRKQDSVLNVTIL
jgi:hypothetical protein